MKNGINIPYTGRGKYLLVMFFFLVLSFVIAFLSITGNARIMFLILVFSLIPIILAYDFKKSIMGLIVFYAFMGFFRRFFYTINPYTRLDPIYIIPDIFASTLFVYLLILKKNKIFREIKGSLGMKIFTILIGVMFLQMFNPLQGGIAVGIGGGKFWLIPMLWFFFGIFFDKDYIEKVFNLLIILGFLSAIYGIKQVFWGFFEFEKKWLYYVININKFSSIFVHSVIRPFSFFPSPQEYADFLMITLIIAFTAFLFRRNKILYSIVFLVILYAKILLSVRGTLLLAFFSFILILMITSRKKKLAYSITGTVLFFYIILANLIYYEIILPAMPVNFIRLYTHIFSGIVDPFSRYSTVWERIMELKNLPLTIAKYPIGMGIGTTSLAGRKFGGVYTRFEVSLFAMIAGASIFAGILYIGVVVASIRQSIVKFVNTRNWIYPMIAGIVFAYFIVGGLTVYSTSAIYWFLIGFSLKADEK